MIETTPTPRTWQIGLARFLTDVLAPVPVGVVGLIVIAWRYSATVQQAAKWISLSIVFIALVPLAYIIVLLRRGEITDIHISKREHRPRIVFVSFLSWVLALVLLSRLGAPSELVAFIAGGTVALVVAGAITLRWKISFHMGVAAGVLTMLALLFGGRALLPAPLLLVLGWARVELHAHTPAQVIAGAIVGGGVSGGVFALLSRFPG